MIKIDNTTVRIEQNPRQKLHLFRADSLIACETKKLNFPQQPRGLFPAVISSKPKVCVVDRVELSET